MKQNFGNERALLESSRPLAIFSLGVFAKYGDELSFDRDSLLGERETSRAFNNCAVLNYELIFEESQMHGQLSF